MPAQYRPDSFYAVTPIRSFYLDLWQDPNLAFSEEDKEKEIPIKYDRRPDLMAYEEYGSSRYWWIFALRNKNLLIDPVEDFRAGLSIKVPSKNSILNIG